MVEKNKSCSVKKTSIGGQALMEGIMMRGPELTAMAVRNTEGEIVLEEFPTESKKRAKFFKLPIVRGVFNYIDSMVQGTKCLMRSAEISGLEEAEEELRKEKEAKKAAKKNKANADLQQNEEQSVNQAVSEETEVKEDKKQSSFFMGALMTFSVILGIGFSIALFVIIPSFLYSLVSRFIPFLKPENLAVQSLIKSIFEGVLKIVILVAYMSIISLMKDIKRTFMYHGAEHKAIFCYESGKELTVENVRMQKRFHPRCGTSFLILMLLIGIFISFFIDPLFLAIFGFLPITIVRVLIKLLLLPFIVGIGYEFIKIAGRYDNLFTRIISAPGVWLQHITTKEPDDQMIECAILALEKVIPENGSDNW